LARPQSGNAAWRAAMEKHKIQKGLVNRRVCVAIARHSGKPCGQLAMRGVPICKWHGGQMLQARLKGLKEKHAAKQRAEHKRSAEYKGRIKAEWAGPGSTG